MSRGIGRREGDVWRRSGYGVGGAFAPTSIPDLALWLRADMGVTTVAGPKISAWADQSGFARDFAQTVDARRPAYVASEPAFSGQPCARFAAAHIVDSLAAMPAFASGMTLVIAIGNTPSQAGNVLFEAGTGSGANSAGIYIDPGPTYRSLYQNPAGSYTQYNSTSPPTASSYIVTIDPIVAAASQVRSYIDNVLGSASTTSASPGSIASNVWHIGARTPVTAPCTADIAEFIAYSRVITASERALITAYQQARFG